MASLKNSLQLGLLMISVLCCQAFALVVRQDSSDLVDRQSAATSADQSANTLSQLNQDAFDAAFGSLSSSKRSACNINTVRIRREWRTLPVQARKDFINAVKCVRAKPSLYPAGMVPGSKSLYDDYIAVHLNQTLFIHLSGYFLTWHRYYTWDYENKLNACGYHGALPYWEWGLDTKNVSASPIFDGSPLSLGGDGARIPHQGLILPQVGSNLSINLPPGTGGGCVTTGPFGNLTMRLGPVALATYGSPNSTGVANPFGDNLRCLKRDLNAAVAAKFSSFQRSADLVLQSKNVETFQAIMQGDSRYVAGSLGVHGGGHFTIGGDPGADPFISPGDPAFFLHHSQVDRLYWMWQMLDFPKRQTVFGTGTLLNYPPSPNVTVDDYIDIAPLTSQKVQIKNIMNTVGGSPLCYLYA